MGLSWKLLIMETLVLAVWWLVSGLLGRGWVRPCLDGKFLCLGHWRGAGWGPRAGLSGSGRGQLSCSWVLNGPLLVSCMSIFWDFQISSQRKLWWKPSQSLKRFSLFFMCLKSMRSWSTEQKEANSTSMDLLIINSRNTQTQGHIWIQSLAWSATSFPVPASLSGFSSTLLDSHFTPSSPLSSHSDPGTPDFMWKRAGVWALGIFEGPEAQSWQVLSCQGPEWTLIHKSAAFLWLLMRLLVPVVLAPWSFPTCLLFMHWCHWCSVLSNAGAFRMC